MGLNLLHFQNNSDYTVIGVSSCFKSTFKLECSSVHAELHLTGCWNISVVIIHRSSNRCTYVLLNMNNTLATFRLVAAKCDYFGVGGSVSSFLQYVQASQQFVGQVVKHINTGEDPPLVHSDKDFHG